MVKMGRCKPADCKGFEELEISMACIAFSLCYEVNCTDLVKGW